MNRMLCLAAILAALNTCALAQGQPVNQVLNPPPANWTYLYWCGSSMTTCGTGNTNVTAICMAPAATSTPTVYAIGGSPALTNITVATNVGTINFAATAQLWVGQRVTVSGSTTSALNGTYRINAVSGSTATITTVGVGDDTYNNAALTISTTAPLLDALTWSIQIFTYTNSSVNASYYAGGGIQITQGLACSNRTAY